MDKELKEIKNDNESNIDKNINKLDNIEINKDNVETKRNEIIGILKELIINQNKTFINANINLSIAIMNNLVISNNEIYKKEANLIRLFKY